VDCIVGAAKQMHTVIEELCTGCELCVPVCPVDCISMLSVTGERSGWAAWSAAQAEEARERYAFHRRRVERDKADSETRLEAKAEDKLADLEAASRIADPAERERKRAMIEAVLAKTRARRGADEPR